MKGYWRFSLLLVVGVFIVGAPAMAAPPGERPGASGGFSFRVEIEGVTTGEFSEVSGLSSETEVVEFREGGDVERIRKVPGITRFADIVLAAEPDNPALDDLWVWRREIMDGTTNRRNGSIVIYDHSGGEVARYTFTRAWPSKWTGPTPKGKGGKVFVEEVTIAVEFIERS